MLRLAKKRFSDGVGACQSLGDRLSILKNDIKYCCKLIIAGISVIILLINSIKFLTLLAVNYRRIKGCELIVIPSTSVNFGNSVYLPDALRRIHKGKRILFIIPWDKGSGPNTATANIFPDVDIWFFKLLMVRLTLFEKKIALVY